MTHYDGIVTKEHVGIWLDSGSAILVFLSDGRTSIQRIESGVESRFRTSGGSRSKSPYGPQEVASESKAENRRKRQHERYFRKIFVEIARGREFLILGPGETKLHFATAIRMERALSGRLRKVETADRMSERQLIAKVKKFFLSDPARSS
jgi:hypothetical protein